jgi:hypothetical protein
MMHEPQPPRIVPGALPPGLCAALLQAAQALQLPAGHPDVQPTSGSVRLHALGPALFEAVLQALAQGPAGAELQRHLGPQPLCLATQCWLRRQYPAALRPAGQHPHQWHQDGALGCRFEAGPGVAPETLAPLLTAWVPLVDCGDDAPSLEWLLDGPPGLVPPAGLLDAALPAGPAARRHARLAAGQALLFGPALLHRTHVTPAMRQPRVSVELRFVTPLTLPERLRGESCRALPPAPG